MWAWSATPTLETPRLAVPSRSFPSFPPAGRGPTPRRSTTAKASIARVKTTTMFVNGDTTLATDVLVGAAALALD
jgi:hypothetical protein